MRHITDGELHAYLDGALDLLSEGRAQEVRAHLDSCSACQERLQDEGKIRDQAHSLLGSDGPGEEVVPPFEELRARAEALDSVEGVSFHDQEKVSRYRGPLTGASLAWAATVVLALGVGWMGGEVWRGGALDEPPATNFPESLAEPAVEVSQEPRAAAPTLDEVMKSSEAPSPPSETLADEVEDRSGVLGQMGVDNSLAVPGLAVLSVEWEEWVPGEKALHIRQLLPPSDTLELRYLGMLMGLEAEGMAETRGAGGVAPEATVTDLHPFPRVMEASLPKGWNQVVMRRGGGWLVARAPLPEASLRALVRSLRPPGKD